MDQIEKLLRNYEECGLDKMVKNIMGRLISHSPCQNNGER